MPCQSFCISDYGAAFDGHTDDTQAWMRAFDALRPKGGILVLPAGTSRTSRPLFVPNDTIVQGQGREVTKIVNQASVVFRIGQFESFVPVPGGPFPKLQGVRFISFRDLTIESQAPRGGHIFEMVGYTSAICCSWTHLFLKQFNPAKQIFRHFSNPAGGGFQDSLWEHLFMFHGDPVRGINPSVPAFEMSGPGQLFAANTLRNLRCENSYSEPFFRFTCNGMQRHNGCVMSQINFEKCAGGMVHWKSAGNWTCERLVLYDTAETRNDCFLLDKAPAGGLTRHMTFIGCDRRSGRLGNGLVDIRIRPGTTQTTLINCGENPSALYTVDAGDEPLTWIGFGAKHVPAMQGYRLIGDEESVLIGDGIVNARTCISRVPAPRSHPTARRNVVPQVRS